MSYRVNRSSFAKSRTHPLRIINNYDTISSPSSVTQRPRTASLTTYSYKRVNEVQQEIGKNFREGLNEYVKNKLRVLTNKHNEAIYRKGGNNLHSLKNSIKYSEKGWKRSINKPRNVEQMRICEVGCDNRAKVERVVRYPFIVNTQEQLTRMVSKSKESQAKYQSLQSQISEVEKQRWRTQKYGENPFTNPEHVSDVAWDVQWNLSNLKQLNRYKERLLSKHKKASKSMTIQW